MFKKPYEKNNVVIKQTNSHTPIKKHTSSLAVKSIIILQEILLFSVVHRGQIHN